MEVVSSSQGVLGPLLGKLTNLLADECARLKGVRREIRSLRSELLAMQAAVQKYTTLQDPDVQVKQWISMVRELSYDTEDVIDKFIRHLHNGGEHDGGFKEFFRKTARRLKTLGSRCRIANEIDDLKARIKEVNELKTKYKMDDTVCDTSKHTEVDPRLSALFTEEEYLVGIEGPREDLTNWMLEEGNGSFNNLKVLSIVGFGGLGKTTLANQVYQHIKWNFQCHAIVSVSQKPNVKRIIKSIINDMISQVPCEKDFNESIDTWDLTKCIRKLKELLRDKRYLVFVDDIWSVQAWNSISCAFPKNSHSSRILTTTRIVDVARSCCPGDNDRMYEMEVLSDVHSNRLFFKRIFGSEDRCPNMLKDISNELLRKCGGLPLAITNLSGLLANKPIAKDVWERVKRSIGSELGKSDMNNILSLSYNDLPPYLRTCLLYLCMFPEDTKYSRKDLVMRWIAEGFICEERGRSRQEVAESYFYELINRNMIEPVGIGVGGKVRACRVHDMMLELIISKSAEENFVTVAGGGQTVLAPNHGSIRRISLQYNDQKLASVLYNQDLSHVRALIVTASSCIRHLPSLVEFESLRVLDFGICDDAEYDMSDIGKLFHLKYLRLWGTRISNLPSGIVMLHDLETLDLRYTNIDELPAKITQLIKLQHLLLPWSSKIPDGIGNMKSLRMISGLDIARSSVGAVEELGNLDDLEVLKMNLDRREPREFKMHEEMLLSSLGKLGSSKLKSVRIKSGPLQFLDYWSPLPLSLQKFHMTTGYSFPETPKWITPASNSLTYLNINLEKVTDEDLRILGEIPALLSLDVTSDCVQKERLTVRTITFPCLKELYLRSCGGSAIYLTFEEGALPKLEKLELPFFVLIAKSYGFFLGLRHLSCLRYAELTLCSKVNASSEIRDAEAAIMKEASSNPNHPRVFVVDATEEEDSEEES